MAIKNLVGALLVAILAGRIECQSGSSATLVVDLLKRSNPNVRPNADTTGPNVTVSLTVTGAEKVAGRANVIQVGFWIDMQWTDPRLSWQPSDYGNVNSTFLPVSQVWRPELAVWKSANPREPLFSDEERFINVESDGSVYWTPKGIITVYAAHVIPADGSTGTTYITQNILADWDLQIGQTSLSAGNTTIDLSQQQNSGLRVKNSSVRSVNQNFGSSFGQYPVLEVIMELEEQKPLVGLS